MQFGAPDPSNKNVDVSKSGVSPRFRSTSASGHAQSLTSEASHRALLQEVQSLIDSDKLRQITTTAKLTEVYVAEMQKLHRLRREVEDLIPLLCEANLVFRLRADTLVREARDEVLDTKRLEMQQRANLRIRLPNNIVDAHLLALPPETASERLRESLEKNVVRFVSDFFTGLHQLVDTEVAGLVEWTSQNTCCYHFFREVVIQESNTVTKEIGNLHRSKHCADGWDASEETTLQSTHVHRIARHEHHTTDAFHTTISDTEVIMPPAVRAFVDRIPTWLAPIVRIIDGKIAREIIVERDMGTEEWEKTETQDIPVFGNEPAVVIDNVVLTGWGPREIEAELARQAPVAKARGKSNQKKSISGTSLVYFGLGLGASLSSVSLFQRSAENPIAISVSVVIALVAAPIWYLGFQSRSSTERRQNWKRSRMSSIGVSASTIGVGLLASGAFAGPAMSIVQVALVLVGVGLLALPMLLEAS